VKFSSVILFLISFNAFCQREITDKASGAHPNYQPVTVAGPPNCNYYNSGLTLTFNDEFNGTLLDTNKWHPSYPWGMANSDSSDSWCDENEISFTGNSIKLGCNRKVNVNVLHEGNIITREYGIGVISSKQSFNYGFYEIRCKIPRIAELWPAFWIFGDCSQEIDIFEFLGNSFQSSRHKAFHDPLWACSPFKSRWYIPQECATANPIMTWHSPKNTDSPCLGYPNARRVVGRKLEYSEWKIKRSPSNFKRGCFYDDIEVDVDFHNEWHTFGVSFEPDCITWYIDGNIQFVENKYFIKVKTDYPLLGTQISYEPACLAQYCFNGMTEPLYEQMNFPRGDINMKIIINNNHKALPEYNLTKWIDEIANWSDGIFEIDYFRYFSFTTIDKNNSSCKNTKTDFVSFDLFPNPSNGRINISTNSALLVKHLTITNSLGITVYQTFFNSKDLSFEMEIAAGIYFVQLSCAGGRSSKKLIIE
jgi:hypothetical protein